MEVGKIQTYNIMINDPENSPSLSIVSATGMPLGMTYSGTIFTIAPIQSDVACVHSVIITVTDGA